MHSLLRTLPKPEDRLSPKAIDSKTVIWSTFSKEKGIYFNGYGLKTEEDLIIIDPPSATSDVMDALLQFGTPIAVFLTNRDHERDAALFQEKFKISVAIHALDAPLLTSVADPRAFNHKDVLLGGLHVIHLEHQKSPGECAFYQPSSSSLIIGDAVIGDPSGGLSMLPPEKYANPYLALQSLKQLTEINPSLSSLLLGDGEPILEHAQECLELFFVISENESDKFKTSLEGDCVSLQSLY